MVIRKPSKYLNFKSLTISTANFKGVNLTSADFTGAQLSGIDFSNLQMKWVKMCIDISLGIDSMNASECDFTNANMEFANLCGGDFSHSTLINTNLFKAILTKSTFNNETVDKEFFINKI